MRFSWFALAALAACTPESNGLDSGTDNRDGDSDTVGLACAVEEGRCAPDFALPDTTGALVALSDRGGQRVILIGSAMW